MGFGGLFVGALGFLAAEGFKKWEDRPANVDKRYMDKIIQVSESTQMVLPDAKLFEEKKPEWMIHLTDEIGRCCEAMSELYKSINYQPVDGYYGQVNHGMKAPHFAKEWPVTGIRKSGSFYKIGLVGITATVRLRPHAEDLPLINDLVSKVKESLAVIRTKYWVPNRKRYKQWGPMILKMQGLDDKAIKEYLDSTGIPFNTPANDVVYRTPEELEGFDKVADRIVELTEITQQDAIDWYRMKCGLDPSQACYNNMGYLTWEQYGQEMLKEW